MVYVPPNVLPVNDTVVIVFGHVTFAIEISDPLFEPIVIEVHEIKRILQPEPLAVPVGKVILIVTELAIDSVALSIITNRQLIDVICRMSVSKK